MHDDFRGNSGWQGPLEVELYKKDEQGVFHLHGLHDDDILGPG